jgi:hypothetical protein
MAENTLTEKQIEELRAKAAKLEADNEKLRASIDAVPNAPKPVDGDFSVSLSSPGEKTKKKHTFGFHDGAVMIHVPNEVVATDRQASKVYTEKILKLHKGEKLTEEERTDGTIHFFTNEDGSANENVEKLLVWLAERYSPKSKVLKKIK